MDNYKGIKAIVFTMVFLICHMFENNFILKIDYKIDYKVVVLYDISIGLICMTKYEGFRGELSEYKRRCNIYRRNSIKIQKQT